MIPNSPTPLTVKADVSKNWGDWKMSKKETIENKLKILVVKLLKFPLSYARFSLLAWQAGWAGQGARIITHI